MNLERRLRETLAAFEVVEPAPDLFSRVERSVAEDRLRRRRRFRSVIVGFGIVSLGVFVVAGFATRSSAGTIMIPRWPLVAVETVLLAILVQVFGPLIRRFGAVFIEDVFGGSSEGIGRTFLQLLDVAYYLVFIGYVVLTVRVVDLGSPEALRTLLEVTTERFGGLLLLMGIMHAATITALPLVGLIHASTVREQRRTAAQHPPAPTREASFAERVVRIVLWTVGGLATLLLAAFLLNLVVAILVGFEG